MRPKLKVKKVQKTISFDPQILGYITDCGHLASRTPSQEIEFMTLFMQKLREKSAAEAFAMLEKYSHSQGSPQSPESDESSSSQPK